jgi:hypothetical protein
MAGAAPTHFCFQCSTEVAVASNELMCASCGGEFLEELPPAPGAGSNEEGQRAEHPRDFLRAPRAGRAEGMPGGGLFDMAGGRLLGLLSSLDELQRRLQPQQEQQAGAEGAGAGEDEGGGEAETVESDDDDRQQATTRMRRGPPDLVDDDGGDEDGAVIDGDGEDAGSSGEGDDDIGAAPRHAPRTTEEALRGLAGLFSTILGENANVQVRVGGMEINGGPDLAGLMLPLLGSAGSGGMQPLAADLGDYYMGNLERLAQQLAERDPQRHGPPPASKEAVEKLRRTTIPTESVQVGELCYVCQEPYKSGEEVLEMPCKHAFHPGCLKPWLETHNNCPVCRHELPTDDAEYEADKRARAEAANAQASSAQGAS